VLYVKSNCENKTSSAIRYNLEKNNQLSYLQDIKVPSQKLMVTRRGKKTEVEKKIFPGYVLVHLLEDENFGTIKNIILNTENVKKFLGAGNIPTPISRQETQELFHQIKEGKTIHSDNITFNIGDHVEIIEGGFLGLHGEIESIDTKNMVAVVSVTIFGRSTSIELPFSHISLI